MFTEQSINKVGASLLHSFMNISLRLDVEQHTMLPQGPKIFAANHPTTTDPFYMLGLVDEPLTLLVTEMAFDAPVLGSLIGAAGHIPVRDENGKAAFYAAVERLNSGHNIGIFPEGSLSPLEGGVCKARTGTVRMALEAGVPVIPIGIALDWQRIRYVETTLGGRTDTARYYLQGPYAVTIGKAMTFKGSVDDWSFVQSESTRMMARISALACESERRLLAKNSRSVTAQTPLAGE